MNVLQSCSPDRDPVRRRFLEQAACPRRRPCAAGHGRAVGRGTLLVSRRPPLSLLASPHTDSPGMSSGKKKKNPPAATACCACYVRFSIAAEAASTRATRAFKAAYPGRSSRQIPSPAWGAIATPHGRTDGHVAQPFFCSTARSHALGQRYLVLESSSAPNCNASAAISIRRKSMVAALLCAVGGYLTWSGGHHNRRRYIRPLSRAPPPPRICVIACRHARTSPFSTCATSPRRSRSSPRCPGDALPADHWRKTSDIPRDRTSCCSALTERSHQRRVALR